MSSTTRSLGNQYQVGKSSANRILLENNFIYGRTTSTRTLTDQEKTNRVTYCEDMLKRNGKKILATFFSDETGHSLSEAHRQRTWHSLRKQEKVEVPKKDIRLNCWGAISFRGATSLYIYRDTLKNDRYKNILQEHQREMDELYNDGYYFQHDNYRVHTTCESWMKEQHFCMVNFPTYSPDLSPVENIWWSLKQAVAKENPKTEAALEESLRRNWETLTTVRNLQPYFQDLYDRERQCVNNQGEL